ncbi:MAG: DNA topoisomerase IV subunit B, partial [Pseudomonadota bacterium]
RHCHIDVAMPPLYRVDVGKEVHYALDESELRGILDSLSADKRKRATRMRFKGLGEMSAAQLRETTMNPDTRRLVRLTLDANDKTDQTMDMLLAKKRAADRKAWLETKGNLATL